MFLFLKVNNNSSNNNNNHHHHDNIDDDSASRPGICHVRCLVVPSFSQACVISRPETNSVDAAKLMIDECLWVTGWIGPVEPGFVQMCYPCFSSFCCCASLCSYHIWSPEGFAGCLFRISKKVVCQVLWCSWLRILLSCKML